MSLSIHADHNAMCAAFNEGRTSYLLEVERRAQAEAALNEARNESVRRALLALENLNGRRRTEVAATESYSIKPNVNVVQLNGGGLKQLKEDAIRLVFDQEKGSVMRAAKRLKVSRGNLNEIVRSLGLTAALLFALLISTAQAQPPAMPTAPAASVTVPTLTPSVTLAWDHSVDPSVVGYRVYWGAASGNYTNSAAVGYITQTAISNLSAATPYYFAATAYTIAGEESSFSNEANYTTPAPTNGVLEIRVYVLELKWSGPSGTLQSKLATATNWTDVGPITMNGSRYVTNNTPGMIYRVKL